MTTRHPTGAPWPAVLWHLDTAADLADNADTLTELALAAQIRLTRAAYPGHLDPHQPPTAGHRLSAPTTITGHLNRAADLLDDLDTLLQPEPLQQWARLVHDLLTTAHTCLTGIATQGNTAHDWGAWR